MTETFPVLLDGYTDVPPGKIANVVTFVEMTQRPGDLRPLPAGFAAERVEKPDPAWFRGLYRRVGEPWLWFSHAVMPERELAALLAKPTTAVVTLQRNGETIGLIELDFSVPETAEIVSFGLVPEAVGSGAGSALMAAALDHAFRGDVKRVWLHTCTFDHPRALDFYRRAGFKPYKFAIEVSDDPRATGALPADAGPHVPRLRSED